MENVPPPSNHILVGQLGQGAYAAVYKAFRKNNNREVAAIKCIKKKSLNSRSVENMLTEIELMKTLKHENIVHLIDFEWNRDYIYLIMEFCNKGDLSRYVLKKAGHCSENTMRYFIQQIGFALKYMRSMNVSHMDLKPQNILVCFVDGKYVLKIADFGFAHYLIGTVEANIVRGTPLYMAPEVIRHQNYNERADLWSIGVIIYEFTYGRTPFAAKTIEEIVDNILNPSPIKINRANISPDLRDLLTSLLQKDVRKRLNMHKFLDHKFLDMEYAPQSDSLDKGRQKVKKAIEFDEKNDLSSALSCYNECLLHFMASLTYETNTNMKSQLRKQINIYMDRAEEIKMNLMKEQVTFDIYLDSDS